MKKNLLVLFFIGFSLALFGKMDSLKRAVKIDSLKVLINTSTIDTKKAKHLFLLSKYQRKNREYESAIKSMKSSEKLAIRTRSKELLVDIYSGMSILYFISGDIETLGSHLKMAVNYSKSVNDSVFIAFNYDKLGDYYSDLLGEDEIGLQYSCIPKSK